MAKSKSKVKATDKPEEVRAATRKGAARMADVTADVLDGLNGGKEESASLTEALSVDHARLMRAVLPKLSDEEVAVLGSGTPIMARMRAGGQILLSKIGPDAPERLVDHPSDTVRSWACFALGFQSELSLEEMLKRITALADDKHWGVRETAWMAVRPAVASDLEKAIRLLGKWSLSDRENLRRFGSEISRPRGVWCTHIDQLKTDPGLALSILEPLHADPSRYVQNSVANWVNDASKTRPDWAREVCEKWASKSDAAATKYIVKRALRTLNKV